MLQDPNVERYVANAVKPLKKKIKQMKAQIEALNQALRIHDVVGRCELYFAFMEEYNALMGESEHQILKEEVVILNIASVRLSCFQEVWQKWCELNEQEFDKWLHDEMHG